MIGMGTTKQEFFVENNYDRFPRSVYWCVGGLFYLISGERSRAPEFMRENSLEWVYRLVQEPKRLLFRYTFENLFFLYLFAIGVVRRHFQK
jgi:N-acetylglucosaminyldiphosphoundecaprenol N-acetyl-beta-D-mannosaminyltransferase